MRTLIVPLYYPVSIAEPFIREQLKGREVESVKVDRKEMTIVHRPRPNGIWL